MAIAHDDLRASRYLHLLERPTGPIAFNSLTLEMFELDAGEAELLRTCQEGGAPAPDVDVEPFVQAGLLIVGDEEPLRAMHRLAEARSGRRAKRGHFGTLRLSVTERCNMACSYCFQQKMYVEDQPVLAEQTLRSTLEWFLTQGAGHPLTVQYFGGEPLLEWRTLVLAHSLLEEAVAAGRIPAFRETITTNGTLMTPERAAWLADAGVDLTFSFDGPPEENDVHRLLKSGRGTYHAAARGLGMFVAAGGQSSILMTATPQNVRHLPGYVRWFAEESGLAPEVIGINSPQPTADGWETGGAPLADAIWEVWQYCRSAGIRLHGPGTFVPFHLRSLTPQSDGCVDTAPPGHDPSWPVYVSADGRRSLCLVHHNDHRVEVSDPASVHGAGHAWHTAADPVAECDGCIASQICGGPCAVERILWNGRLSDDRCGFMRRMTRLVLSEG